MRLFPHYCKCKRICAILPRTLVPVVLPNTFTSSTLWHTINVADYFQRGKNSFSAFSWERIFFFTKHHSSLAWLEQTGVYCLLIAKKKVLDRPQHRRSPWAHTTRVGSHSLKQMPTFPQEQDGLSPAERRAYAVCRPFSCKHEACFSRFMYSSEALRQEKCGPLFAEWKKCFDAEVWKDAHCSMM